MNEELLQIVEKILNKMLAENSDIDVDDISSDDIIEKIPVQHLSDIDEDEMLEVIDKAKEDYLFG